VFAEGIAGAVKKRYGGRGGGELETANNSIPKPKLNLQVIYMMLCILSA
jgi:hypothetical protein